ncbi:hypothetical protein LCGC14_0810990 [marine sediment metagenome]|uniref:Uncharacterized protein n=1 Tax=marine sediment metagenome TaxID=412755 RepID=A0A0F9SU32_9ZZZZ
MPSEKPDNLPKQAQAYSRPADLLLEHLTIVQICDILYTVE